MKSYTNPVDFQLLSSCLLLLFFGLTTLYSLSATGNNNYFGKQVVFLLLGCGLFYLLYQIPISNWRRYANIGFAAISVLLLLTLLIGNEVNGAKRWINVAGLFSIQPTEFFKLFLLLCLARWTGSSFEKHQLDGKTFIRMASKLAIPLVIICFQPDFGTLVLVIAVTLVVFFLSGLPLKWVFITAVLGSIVISLMAIFEPYRMQRLTSFIDPFSDPYGSGYNQLHSLMGYNAGGISGVGIGQSIEKYQHLPEAQNDFIIAIIAEEWGLIGFLIVCILYLFLITRAIGIARDAEIRGEIFGALYAFGLSAVLSFQVLINIGGSLSILPSKGFTLPLISYGGSSLWATLIMIAILMRLDWENRQSYAKGVLYYARR